MSDDLHADLDDIERCARIAEQSEAYHKRASELLTTAGNDYSALIHARQSQTAADIARAIREARYA